MSDGLFSAVEMEAPGRAGYRLQRIEVFNWGTFDGQVWALAPGADTTLLTGDIGSGKSTLVDALTTLLLPAQRITYNKAAGAGARERTLRTYVEGHYKSERTESTGRSRPIGLRTSGGTYSVILGQFVNDGYGESATIAQVFQQRDTAGQPYRFFVTAAKPLAIAQDFADFGTSLNDLRRRLRSSGAEIFDEYPKYATSLRRLLGIRSEQALELFHQTVSMKSVGNLDDFVRDHMLEPSDSTSRVRDIIGHFDNLTKAYDAVKRAREQLAALDPILATATRYDAALAEREAAEVESSAVGLYIAELRSGLLTAEIKELTAEGERLGRARDAAVAAAESATEERESLIAARAGAGGDRIGELERLAKQAREEADRRRTARTRFDAAVVDAQLAPVTDAAELDALAVSVAEQRSPLHDSKRALDVAVAEAIGAEKQVRATMAALREEIDSLRHRTSNLPLAQVEIRELMCADIRVPIGELPYAGELLDVLDDHAQWRGAAERVLHGFALSLLVPQRHYDAVSRWVNDRRLTVRGRGGQQVGAKLVFERVPARQVCVQLPGHDGLLLSDCLDVKDGPFADYLTGELVRRADFRCAMTLDEFRAERRAVTREGQVRSGERHEKDDRHRVDDPRRWVLGWANENKIAALEDELVDAESRAAAVVSVMAELESERSAVQRKLDALLRLDEFTVWTDIDPIEAETRAAQYDAERSRLAGGSTRLAEIERALARNKQQADEIASTVTDLTGTMANAARDLRTAKQLKEQDDARIDAYPAEELAAARRSYAALADRLGPARPTESAACTQAEATLVAALHRRIEQLSKDLATLGQRLVQLMNAVLGHWPELGADMDATVDARADFLAFRDRVATDDLPRFEAEFKEQLHKNAIQELAGFNNWLGREAAGIDDRVARINEGLKAVPYNPGRYLRLEKEPTGNFDVIQFRRDLRDLTDDSLVADGDPYSEARFADVKRIIERFRGREGSADADRVWTRRVTDVRNWFVFSASERDLDTDQEWEHYSDSDGKSGGQKEKLAYTILAASLAYQFGLEWGAAKSKDFRFAVIDEAFGRGSDASTRYALELFAKLGLQLLVVTPLQKVHVIEPYVRAIGFVDNVTGMSSRVHTMTIDEYREQRDARR
ncbi:MAG: hypothetical protein BGO26_04695 [Actinobacteria bacterium 69-20]|jgi:uncharacterized protein YPO0396|nr:hypothetical protein [Actinomycetota bacterium]OJV26898.1 MAG: hypothetical protein BGO26_04695 [Actinobacteria bacterium 69-20]